MVERTRSAKEQRLHTSRLLSGVGDMLTVCIEISRTYTFGEKGTSEGQFYLKYLKNIKLNDEHVAWKQQKLDYLYKVTLGRFNSYLHLFAVNL